MAYPLKWEEEPPEIPPAGEKVTGQISQFAAELRKQAQMGALQGRFATWLYDYEAMHPPLGGRIYLKISEESHKRTVEASAPATVPPIEGAAVAREEGRRLDRVLDSLAGGIQELRTGFGAVLAELRMGQGALTAGYQELRLGNEQLQADQRSFLGLLFPHMQAVMQQGTEGMAAFRQATLREAEAKSAIAGAQAAATQAQLGNEGGIQQMAERAMVEMFTEGIKAKAQAAGLLPSLPAATTPATPEKK